MCTDPARTSGPGRPLQGRSHSPSLGRAALEEATSEAGGEGLLERLADPLWFQAVAALLGLEHGVSGVTSAVLATLEGELADHERASEVQLLTVKPVRAEAETGGALSERCQRLGCDVAPLRRACHLAARVDTVALQDGYDLYLQAIAFTAEGRWAIIQQGINESTGRARRYHWLGRRLISVINAPHAAIACDERRPTLDLTARSSKASRQAIVELARTPPEAFRGLCVGALRGRRGDGYDALGHVLSSEAFADAHRRLYNATPRRFVDLIEVEGVGAMELRALAAVAELTEGAVPSRVDPARCDFTLGFREGRPAASEGARYDRTIGRLEQAVAEASLGSKKRVEALSRLDALHRAILLRAREAGGDDPPETERSQIELSF